MQSKGGVCREVNTHVRVQLVTQHFLMFICIVDVDQQNGTCVCVQLGVLIQDPLLGVLTHESVPPGTFPTCFPDTVSNLLASSALLNGAFGKMPLRREVL